MSCCSWHGSSTKFHEIQILLIFGLGLQTMIHLIILATRARDVHLIDTTGGRSLRDVLYISISGLGGQHNEMYHDLESKAKD